MNKLRQYLLEDERDVPAEYGKPNLSPDQFGVVKNMAQTVESHVGIPSFTTKAMIFHSIQNYQIANRILSKNLGRGVFNNIVKESIITVIRQMKPEQMHMANFIFSKSLK